MSDLILLRDTQKWEATLIPIKTKNGYWLTNFHLVTTCRFCGLQTNTPHLKKFFLDTLITLLVTNFKNANNSTYLIDIIPRKVTFHAIN